jgi:hypothetical protein
MVRLPRHLRASPRQSTSLTGEDRRKTPGASPSLRIVCARGVALDRKEVDGGINGTPWQISA